VGLWSACLDPAVYSHAEDKRDDGTQYIHWNLAIYLVSMRLGGATSANDEQRCLRAQNTWHVRLSFNGYSPIRCSLPSIARNFAPSGGG